MSDFTTISKSMVSVQQLLKLITDSISCIEYNLDRSVKAEKQLCKKINEKKRQEQIINQAERVKTQSVELIKSCDVYLNIIDGSDGRKALVSNSLLQIQSC